MHIYIYIRIVSLSLSLSLSPPLSLYRISLPLSIESLSLSLFPRPRLARLAFMGIMLRSLHWVLFRNVNLCSMPGSTKLLTLFPKCTTATCKAIVAHVLHLCSMRTTSALRIMRCYPQQLSCLLNHMMAHCDIMLPSACMCVVISVQCTTLNNMLYMRIKIRCPPIEHIIYINFENLRKRPEPSAPQKSLTFPPQPRKRHSCGTTAPDPAHAG